MRIEKDSIGKVNIEKSALYGINAKRAEENFPITNRKVEKEMIIALAEVKKAAAIANQRAGVLDKNKEEAIIFACDEIIGGKYHEAFISDPIQGGAGTSFNMNGNEVIANIANIHLDGKAGDYHLIHPNDHINESQSTNDAYPSAGRIASIRLFEKLIEEINLLVEALEKKSNEFKDVMKIGRTQMQDAVEISLGREFGAYRAVIERDAKRVEEAMNKLHTVNMGATAIGTSVNANEEYIETVVPILAEVTGLNLIQGKDLVDATQNLDSLVEGSGSLKILAVNLSKIANDLRLMSSGPFAGFGEINLPKKQAGSSIMPGKVNPVIPEVISQISYMVIGNDLSISMGAEGGQLELNAFEPMILDRLFESLNILRQGIYTFRVNCIEGITANKEHMEEVLDSTMAMVTKLVPKIGYEKASEIAAKAMESNKNVKDIIKMELGDIE